MTQDQREYLNDFFVHVFNKILAWEERTLSSMGASDLSVKELHVLEAVDDQTAAGCNTMSAVAQALSVRLSTLTTAVNTLVRKGYLERSGEPEDRRVIRITLTEKGRQANELHSAFHARMVERAAAQLEEGELEVLIASLRQLDLFFTESARDGQKQ